MDLDTWLDVIRTDFDAGDYAAVKRRAELVIRDHPANPVAYRYQALALDKFARREAAIRTLVEGLALAGFDPVSLAILCDLILGRGAAYAEVRLLRDVFAGLPPGILASHPRLRFFAAEAEFHIGNKPDALRVMARLPQDVVAPHYYPQIADLNAPMTGTTPDGITRFTAAFDLGDVEAALALFPAALACVTPGTDSDTRLMHLMGRLEATPAIRAATSDHVHFEITGVRVFDATRPLVFDTILYNGEDQLLDIHLNASSDVVDHFVIVEGNRSFTGREKTVGSPLQNPRFAAFAPKITHILLDFRRFDLALFHYAWFIEALHRNAAHRTVLAARSACELAARDTHIISDVDEIIKREALATFQQQAVTLRAVRLREHKFFLNLQYFGGEGDRQAGLPTFTTLCTGRVHATRDPQTLRNVTAREPHCVGHAIIDGGWHFSSVGDEDALVRKYNSYSHIENTMKAQPRDFFALLLRAFAQDTFRKDDVRARLRAGGVDVAGFHPMPVTQDSHPAYVVDNIDRFRNLLIPPSSSESLSAVVAMLQRRSYHPP